MADTSEAPDYTSMLRAAGLRVTRPRLSVMAAVEEHPHADTESVIGAARELLPDISHQTVDNWMKALASMLYPLTILDSKTKLMVTDGTQITIAGKKGYFYPVYDPDTHQIILFHLAQSKAAKEQKHRQQNCPSVAQDISHQAVTRRGQYPVIRGIRPALELRRDQPQRQTANNKEQHQLHKPVRQPVGHSFRIDTCLRRIRDTILEAV